MICRVLELMLSTRAKLLSANSLLRPFSMEVRFNSNRTSITKVNRKNFARLYPTVLVNPDGSTLTIRHKEPRAIIQLPMDLSTLTEAEKAARLAKRKPKKKIAVEEDIEDSFDVNRYSHLWKKK